MRLDKSLGGGLVAQNGREVIGDSEISNSNLEIFLEQTPEQESALTQCVHPTLLNIEFGKYLKSAKSTVPIPAEYMQKFSIGNAL